MLKLIGIKRALLMVSLIAVNLFILGVFLLFVLPAQIDADQRKMALDAGIGELQGKIQSIKTDLIQFKIDLPKYETLKSGGFFLEQDRFKIDRDLTEIRAKAGVSGFAYEVGDVVKIKNVDAEVAKMDLVRSQIKINNVTSLLDINFFRFLQMAQRDFPAHMRLQSFTIKRESPVNDALLQAIAEGKPMQLLRAEAVFDWMTLIPQAPPKIDPVTGQPIVGGQ